MPGLPWRDVEPLTRRQKRLIWAAGVIVVAIVAGVFAWAATHSGTYGSSSNGCVTVVVPGSTGAQTLHQCGEAARQWCRNAFATEDRLSQLARPQCREAGLGPEQLSPAPATPTGG
jgi:hypothetical protein